METEGAIMGWCEILWRQQGRDQETKTGREGEKIVKDRETDGDDKEDSVKIRYIADEPPVLTVMMDTDTYPTTSAYTALQNV